MKLKVQGKPNEALLPIAHSYCYHNVAGKFVAARASSAQQLE